MCQAPDGVATQNHIPAKTLLVEAITVEGNGITKTAVILREIGLHAGDTVSADSTAVLVERIKQRLFNLQLFNEVEPKMSVDTPGGRSYVHIRVRERWFIIPTVTVQFADRNFNTWWVKENHDLRRAMVGLTLTDKNFRGNLESLAVAAQAGYTQKIGISYLRPYANSRQTRGFGFLASISQSRQAYFNTIGNKLVYAGDYTGPVIQRQFEGGLSYVYRPAYASRHILQLNYKDYSVRDTIVRLNPDYFKDGSRRARFLELFYRYEYNGVDNWNYSLSGEKVVAYGILRKGFTGLDFQGYGQVEAGLFRPLAPKWYFATVFRGRLMYPQRQPYYFQGGLGTQTDYVRGYEYYVIDGSHYGLLRVDLKRELINRVRYFSLKYFTAIPLRIYPKIFADAGYINNPLASAGNLSNHLLYSYGAGIDIVTLYDIKIRLEYAWNHLSQNGLYLHFNSE